MQFDEKLIPGAGEWPNTQMDIQLKDGIGLGAESVIIRRFLHHRMLLKF